MRIGQPGTIKRDCVFVLTFAQHICRINTCHLFNGAVPCDHIAGTVNGECGIRQEIDDVSEAFLGFNA